MISSLDEWVRAGAARFPDRPVLIDENGQSLTYRALDEKVGMSARAFGSLGLTANTRVALLSRNSFESVTVYFALLRAGAAVVWLNHSLPNTELSEIVRDSEAAFLLHEDEFIARATLIASFEGGPRALAVGEFFSLKPSGSVPARPKNPEALAAIVYTSGSTDKPLGVMLTHRNFISNNEAIRHYLELSEKDTVCCVLPFYYIYGLSLLLSHVAAGATVFLENRFSYPQVVAESLETSKATGFSGVSSHYAILMNRTDFLSRRLPALRYFTHAGDKMPVSVTAKITETFPRKKLFLMYGQTEASPRISYLDPALVGEKPASAGRPLQGVELKILNEQGEVCASGEEGEIVIRGENVMSGYWKRPEETGRALRDGRLFTGDLGYVDGDGDLFVTGRKKLFIKVGGRRVSLAEVESMALEFPGVREAAAVGTPDETLGEKIRLYVALKNEGALNGQTLKDHYKTKAPFYKVPSEVVIVPTIPRNSQGKIDRQRLARMQGVSSSDFLAAVLGAIPVEPGDILLVSSDLTGLGLQALSRGASFSTNEFLEALQAKLGPSGTLLLPTFNFDFCEGKPFDLRRSPSRTGALSKAALLRKDFRRTRHPIHSFAVWGKEQGFLCGLENRSSFGPDSPFDFLHRKKAKMFILGLGYQGALTFVHYVEEAERAPYRVHKEFRGPYIDETGREEIRSYTLYARDLERGVESAVDPMGEFLETKKIAVSTEVFGVPCRWVRLAESYAEIAKDIHENQGRRLCVFREATRRA